MPFNPPEKLLKPANLETQICISRPWVSDLGHRRPERQL
jgi:hypothetical protein